MDSYTVSLSMDKNSEYHSRRQDAYGNEYIPLTADRSLKDKNVVIYDCGNDKAHLNEYMKPFIDEYNDSPTCKRHKERKKSYNYYESIRDGSEGYGKGKAKEKAGYHMVGTIGNNDELTCVDDSFDKLMWRELRRSDEAKASEYLQEHYVYNPKREKAKKLLEIYARNFLIKANNNPNIIVHGLIIHDDEPCAAPHLDIRISLVCVDQKSGLKSRVSMNKAMQQMGYGKTAYKNAPKDSNGFYMLQPWWEDEKNEIEAVMNANGWTREIKGDDRGHTHTNEHWNEMEGKAYSTLKKEAETASKQRDLLKKGLDQMAEQGEALLNEKEAKIEALNASNTEKDSKIEALNANMNTMSEDLHALDEAKSRTEAENEALRASNAQKDTDIEALQSDYKDLSTQNKDLADSVVKKDAKIEALQNDLVEKERLIAQNEALYKEIDRLRDENMVLSTQNDKKNAENKALVNEIVRKDAKIEALNADMNAVNNDLYASRKAKSRTEAENKALKDSNAQKDDKIKQQEAEIRQKDSLIDELKKQIKSLKQKIDSIATYARDVIQAFKNGVSAGRIYNTWKARIEADNVTFNPVEIPISTPIPSPTPMPLRTVRHDVSASSLQTDEQTDTSKDDKYNPLDFADSPV